MADEPGALVDCPTPTHVAMDLVQSRVHARLFGEPGRTISIGRFTALGPLGAGGMGVVFAAHDPVLDRRVAIKLVSFAGTARSGDGEVRLLAEAQAMARLAHPNVVAVHEVGRHDGGIYIAMECIEGETLEAWLERSERPSSAAILDAFVQAGRGLAAAHRAGLIHRDFKPGNAMIDDAGRVRVLDFGLAVGSDPFDTGGDSTEPRGIPVTASLGGTPVYMAPELLCGAPASARSDQYAFCISLWLALLRRAPPGTAEANAGRGPRGASPPPAPNAPRWLRRVLRRGLAGDPTTRWPSMDALLHQLETGGVRARRHRSLASVVALALVVIAILGISELAGRRRARACVAAGREIEAIWNDEARRAARAGLAMLTIPAAQQIADRIVPLLDAQATAWTAARTESCVIAEVEGRWSPQTARRATACLDDARAELATFATELAHPDDVVAHAAIESAHAFAGVDRCLDERALAQWQGDAGIEPSTMHALRTELVRASSLGFAGRPREGLVRLERVRGWAAAVGAHELVAEATRSEAALLRRTGRDREAAAAASTAYFSAAELHAWATAFDAACESAVIAGLVRDDAEAALVWIRHAQVAMAQLGDGDGLRRARVLHLEAAMLLRTGEYAAAIRAADEGLALRTAALGDHHPSLADHLQILGIAHTSSGEAEAGLAAFSRALAVLEQAYGPDHPDTIDALFNAAGAADELGRLREAEAMYRRAYELGRRIFGPEHRDVAIASSAVGVVQEHLGEYRQAAASHRAALQVLERVLSPEHIDLGRVYANLANAEYALGELDDAHHHAELALAIAETAEGTHDLLLAQTLETLGIIACDRGALDQARELGERVLAIREKILGPDHPLVWTALDNLALAALRVGDHARAQALIDRAIASAEAEAADHGLVFAHLLLVHAELARARGDITRARADLERGLAIHDAHEGTPIGERELRDALDRLTARARGTPPTASAAPGPAARAAPDADG